MYTNFEIKTKVRKLIRGYRESLSKKGETLCTVIKVKGKNGMERVKEFEFEE